MSSLENKGNRWYIIFYHQKKRFKKSLKLKSRIGKREINRKLAEQLQTEIDADLARGLFPSHISRREQQTVTFYGFMREFAAFLDKQKTRYKARTVEHYKYSFDVMRKIIRMDVPLQSVTRQMVAKEIQPYIFENFGSNHSARGILADMRAAFNHAIEWQYISDNPFAGMVPKPPKSVVDFFEMPEIDIIRDYCNRPDIPQWQGDWIFFTLNTGLRKLEALALEWSHIRMDAELMFVTGKGNKRDPVPLNRTALAILQERPRRGDSPRVFWEIESKSALESAWRRLRQRTGISGGIHKLRKTYSSHMAMKNENLLKIMDRLRHSDVQTTLIYTKLNQAAFHEGKELVNFARNAGEE